MNRARTTSQDRSRRRKATVVIIVGVVVLVGWIAAVSALAGGSGGSQQGGAEGSASDSPGQNQEASPESAPEATVEEGGENGQGEQSSADQGEGGQPPVDQGAQTEETVAGEAGTEDVFDPLEEEAEGDSQSQGGSTASDEAAQVDTREVELTRTRAASEDFITAAYGYSGESEDEYIEGIEQAASEEISDSPGGSMLEGYSRAASECGMKSTAILDEFTVIGQSPEGLDATVTFRVEDGDGQVHQFTQDQRLTISGGSYEVSGVSMEELISETTPRESCPGAQSSDASSSEGVQDEIKPDSIGVADEDRLKSAADRYITSAYGYTGDSGEEYRQRVDPTVDEETFYSSPGGEQVRGYARAAEQDGITAATVMESFEITSTGSGLIEGTAYFRVGSSYNRYGELEGEGKPFAIDLTLTPLNSAYEVSEASLERERSGRQTPDSRTKKTS